MTWPTKFNRKDEPLKELLELVLDSEQYKKTHDGKIKVMFDSLGAAEYRRQRLYTLFKLIRKDCQGAPDAMPEFPQIKRQGAILIFSEPKEYKERVWRVVGEEDRHE